MTGGVGIVGLGAYLPARVMTNEEWATRLDTSDEWIRSRTGIRARRVAAEDESTVDLAAAASERALVDAGVDADAIDEIIVATDTPEVFIPDTAAFLQHRIGAREIPAYDLAGSGCAGFLQAMDVARARILLGRERVLVVGVELLTRLMNWDDRNTAVLFGDAAAAVVMARVEEGRGILAATAGTDGSRWDILTLEAGGTRLPFSADVAARGAHRDVVMHGREVFRSAVQRMSAAAREVLAAAGRSIDEVVLFVPHQANRRIIDAVGKSLGIDPDRVYVNVGEVGNTGSASVPVALAEARDEGRLAPGDLVLLVSFGAGFHWAASLLRW